MCLLTPTDTKSAIELVNTDVFEKYTFTTTKECINA